jgi:hypothetical protein
MGNMKMQVESDMLGKKRLKAIYGSYSTYSLEDVLYSYPNEFLHSSPEALLTPSGVRDLC